MLSKATAGDLGVADGDPVTVGTGQGAHHAARAARRHMVDGVVWVPTNSAGSTVRRTLGVLAGAEVGLTAGADVPADAPGGAE